MTRQEWDFKTEVVSFDVVTRYYSRVAVPITVIFNDKSPATISGSGAFI